VNQDEVESQLSAMFDGELPATECELLSRRIDRDDNLRARWSRYALIGAAMRSEPVATARSGFARRVSVALAGGEPGMRVRRGRTMIFHAAMSASLVAAVAGLSISMLRYSANGGGAVQLAHSALASGNANVDLAPPAARTAGAGVPTALLAAAGRRDAAVPASAAGADAAMAVPRRAGNSEPVSYVTPASVAHATTALRTELADFIVAHSEYSTQLMRRNLLSALVSNEDGADSAAPGAAAAPGRAVAPGRAAAGAVVHAGSPASVSSR